MEKENQNPNEKKNITPDNTDNQENMNNVPENKKDISEKKEELTPDDKVGNNEQETTEPKEETQIEANKENTETQDNVQENISDKDEKKKDEGGLKNVSPKKQKKLEKKEVKKQKKQAIAEVKKQKKAEKAMKNTRWFWFFILLLIGIILLFIWDTHRKTNYFKAQQRTIDSLTYSEHFFRTKYAEKDSALNTLLADYNKLLEQNLKSSKQLTDNEKELLRLQKIVYIQDSILRQVKSSFEVALSKYDRNQVSVKMKDGKLYITMRNKLLFPSGSAMVQSSGMPALRIMARILKHNPNIDIVVEGHTDNVPLNPKNKKFKDNWELSTARAVEVTRILTDKYHIRPERLTAAGRSMYYPVAPNTTAAGRAKNRRIEFIMTPNLEELYKIADSKPVAK